MDINKNNVNDTEIRKEFIQKIAKSDNGKDVYMTKRTRYLNSIFLGLSGTGKTKEVLQLLVNQDIKNNLNGVTVIVNDEDIAFNIFTMAKNEKRKVLFINPMMLNLYDFMMLEEYNYDFINENIIDYKKAIKNKYIVIINLDFTKYKDLAIKGTTMLLSQLRNDIMAIDNEIPHFLYIDDSYLYKNNINTLLKVGKKYNLGTYLFSNSTTLFGEYWNDISLNIRSTFLLNALSYKDIEYYKKIFYEQNLNDFLNRDYLNIIYETLKSNNKRINGICVLNQLDREYMKEIEAKSRKTRRNAFNKLNRKSKNIREEEDKRTRKKVIEEVKEDILKNDTNDKIQFISVDDLVF